MLIMRMRFVAIILILGLVLADFDSEDLRRKYRDVLKLCTKEVGINFKSFKDYVQKMKKGDKDMQLFCKCCLEKLGQLDDNGEILYEKVKEAPAPLEPCEEASKMIDYCKSQKGKTTLETAYKFTKCIFDKASGSQDEDE
ncbi:hypothetical protein FQA39_LY13668 [Lamprigera yunnana]|nr:hypothetical protein FQA39_LY13668 [Lamprigera yunnana]